MSDKRAIAIAVLEEVIADQLPDELPEEQHMQYAMVMIVPALAELVSERIHRQVADEVYARERHRQRVMAGLERCEDCERELGIVHEDGEVKRAH